MKHRIVRSTLVRALRTFIQSLLGALGASFAFDEQGWVKLTAALGSALGASFIAVLMNLESELDQGDGL